MTFLPVPCFSRISPRATLFCVFFSLALAVVLKYSAPPPGEKIVQDCKSTLNQQWDGTESYLSAAECAYCFIKKKKKEEMLFYCRCRTSAAQNRADPLMSPVVLFFSPSLSPEHSDPDAAGHQRHLVLVLPLSSHPCEVSGKKCSGRTGGS